VLFEKSPHAYGELAEMAKRKQTLPRFSLSTRMRASVRLTRGDAMSENVIGRLDGTDPELREEFVVLTAHLDHLGLAADGADRVFNGAMDNASGIATMIEVARALARNPPKRSVLFCAVTGEEKGLLGSRFLAVNPGVKPRAIAANINFDMFLPIHPMKSLMAIGIEESTLRAPLEAAAERLGLGLQGDPEPARRRYIRSDQYSFIQRGVPAVALKVGYAKDSPEEKLQKTWTATRYHAVSDDLSQPVDLEAAALFNRAVEAAVREIGAGARPRWNEESFFRRFAH
jgi:Zn-dependent M28 family amino/carboxypeptidase